MTATIQFLGAAQTVTGSKFLLDACGQQVLVDCGLFQGMKELRLRNWDPMPIEPSQIDAVVLTHAHIDHCGYLPRLVQQGYAGPVFASPATVELVKLMLPDSGHLQEEEARFANEGGYSKHKPALPLYTKAEAEASLKSLRILDYGRELEVVKGIRVALQPSGHLLGAASAVFSFEGRRLLASGDLGGYDCAVMRPPAPIPADMDYLLVECTYGGRVQDPTPVQDQMRSYMKPVLDRGGVVVIPSFAVGRTTILLYHLRQLQERGELPDVPVYVDSPMATDASGIYMRYACEHNIKPEALRNPHGSPLRARQTQFVRNPRESMRLCKQDGPMIVISASGMATGGRILHHLEARLPDSRNLILLAGYQAAGTRGRLLKEGAKTVKMHGEEVPVRADVASIEGMSAHGDSQEILRWLETSPTRPKRTFLVHGEPAEVQAMSKLVGCELGWETHIPRYLEKIVL